MKKRQGAGKESGPGQLLRKSTASLAALGSLSALVGCGRAPSFNILGSYFPAWLICMVVGIVLAAIVNWLLARFKEWGLDAHIESFDVLFPTPKERVVELLEPTKFRAKLQEPVLAIDPTSSQTSEQLPTYNAYSADGDVTAPLVYVNYGDREDYEQLDRLRL